MVGDAGRGYVIVGENVVAAANPLVQPNAINSTKPVSRGSRHEAYFD
jgi:hypothetical protein